MSRLALNLATVFPASLERKLYAAGAAGFRAVGLLANEMLREGDAGLTELRLSQLAVAEVIEVAGWADADRAARTVAIGQAERVFELAAAVRASLVVAAAPSADIDTIVAADRFRELCRLAAPLRLRVGLEFVGWADTIKDVASAWAVVEAADAANGGLVVDTFHYYRGGSTLEMLEPLPGDRIYLVQLSDCMELPKYELQNRHRVYPGAGAIPLDSVTAAIRAKDYRGYFSVELYNEGYWAEDPVVVARDAFRSLRGL
jgi:2-keto-myo-inositol isomerase